MFRWELFHWLIWQRPALPISGNGRPVAASLRSAMVGDCLLVRVDTADVAPRRGAHLWDGSSIELFVAPRPGAPATQFIAAPAMGGDPEMTHVNAGQGPSLCEVADLVSNTDSQGWMLAVAIPLSAMGIDPRAESLVLDLVVNATTVPGASMCRTHLASEVNPFGDSAYYLRADLSQVKPVIPSGMSKSRTQAKNGVSKPSKKK